MPKFFLHNKKDKIVCGLQERVTCKVDLNRMKVRIRGPSEDLKQLDAAQLINLLDKFQCQELVINTGDDSSQVTTNQLQLLTRRMF